jgi:hypothetical protein
MPISLLADFQDTLSEVHAMGIFLHPKQESTCCWGAVDKWGLERLEALEMVTVDMTQEACQWRRLREIGAEEIDSDARELAYYAVEG